MKLPPLSDVTALVPQLLLVGYLITRLATWHLPITRGRWSLLFGVGGGALLLGVVAALVQHPFALGREALSLLALHLLPLMALFLALRVRGEIRAHATNTTGVEGTPAAAVRPENRSVEKLDWDQVVVPTKVKEDLLTICSLLRDPSAAARYGIDVPKGILLAGPPGTGKTTIAKVLANQAGMSFFALKADEVVSKWVGDSEKNLTALFRAAEKHAPSIIFIDEIDSIGQLRSGDQRWAEMLLNHLLQLIDGVVRIKGLYIVAATNRPDLVDPALKRSGRLNREVEIPLPDRSARQQLLKLYLSKLPLHGSVRLDNMAGLTEGCSGADIKELCSQAGLYAFQRERHLQRKQYTVEAQDLEAALSWFRSQRGTAAAESQNSEAMAR